MTFINLNKVKEYLLEKEKKENFLKQKERGDVIRKLKGLDFVCEKYGIDKVYLYGAFADMTIHKYSDIDIAIEPKIQFGKLLQICASINKFVKREIDLRLLSELPFSAKIKKRGLVIYERKNIHT